MRRPEAMKRAHNIVALIIEQARGSSPDSWADDQNEHDLIDACVVEIQHRHERAGTAGSSSTQGGETRA